MSEYTENIEFHIDNFNQDTIRILKECIQRHYASISGDELKKVYVNYKTEDGISSSVKNFETFCTATSGKRIFNVTLKLWNRNCSVKIKKDSISIESKDSDICNGMKIGINCIKANLDSLLQSRENSVTTPTSLVPAVSSSVSTDREISQQQPGATYNIIHVYGDMISSAVGANSRVGNDNNINGSNNKIKNSANISSHNRGNGYTQKKSSFWNKILENIRSEMISKVALWILKLVASLGGLSWLYEIMSV